MSLGQFLLLLGIGATAAACGGWWHMRAERIAENYRAQTSALPVTARGGARAPPGEQTKTHPDRHAQR